MSNATLFSTALVFASASLVREYEDCIDSAVGIAEGYCFIDDIETEEERAAVLAEEHAANEAVNARMHAVNQARVLVAKAIMRGNSCPVAPVTHICGWYDIY